MNNDKSPDSIQEQEINLVELITKIVKHKYLILAFTGAALIISIVFSLLKPTLYTATARVVPPYRQNARLLSALAAVIDPWEIPSLFKNESLEENASVCAGILRSRPVQDAVIRRLDLTKAYETNSLEDTRKILKSKVRMEIGKDLYVSITAKDKDPKRAAAISNTFVEELKRKYIQLNLIQVGAESVFLAKMVDEIKKDLHESEASLKFSRAGDKASKVNPKGVAASEGVGRINKVLLNGNTTPKSSEDYRKNDEVQPKLGQEEASRIRDQLAVYEQQQVSDARYKKAINELDTILELFESLARQYGLARLTEAKNPSSVQVLEDAVPVRENKLKRSLLVISASTVAAFFIGIFLAFGREYMENMPENDRARWREIKNLARFRTRQ